MQLFETGTLNVVCCWDNACCSRRLLYNNCAIFNCIIVVIHSFIYYKNNVINIVTVIGLCVYF